MTEQNASSFKEWTIIELMGHQRAAGLASQSQFPAGFIRLDIPSEGDGFSHTRFINPQSVYAFTVVDEPTARAVAAGLEQTPVSRWEVRSMLPGATERMDDPPRDEFYDENPFGHEDQENEFS